MANKNDFSLANIEAFLQKFTIVVANFSSLSRLECFAQRLRAWLGHCILAGSKKCNSHRTTCVVRTSFEKIIPDLGLKLDKHTLCRHHKQQIRNNNAFRKLSAGIFASQVLSIHLSFIHEHTTR